MKYPRSFHWPESLSIHSDDRVHQNPDFFVGKEVIITEKLDGSNTLLHNGEVYGRATGLPSRDGWRALVWTHHAWKTLGDVDNYVFGEDISAKHSLNYEVNQAETYSIFNIYDGSKWLSWDEILIYASAKNFRTVPLLYRGTFDSAKDITKWFNINLKEPSQYGVEREGFVMRLADEFTDFSMSLTKFVRPNHVATDQHWTRNWQWNDVF